MTKPFSLFLALRYLRPKRTFLSLITVISILGVTLGIMVLILVISVMTGFEQELVEILRTLQAGDMNAVFITTDVHFAEVFRYTPFANDPDFQVHEVVIGPGNAGIFPNRAFDTSLGTESLFFHGPESAAAVTSWEEALKWFNYGTIEIDGKGHFVTRVKDTFRKTLYSLELTP